jgi:preprotein translocase subunit SecG
VLKKFTAYLAITFIAFCVLLSLWTGAMGRSSVHPVPASIEQIPE